MRLHLVALPHTTLTDRDISCAYSQKVRRAVPMFRAQGYEVILYGPDVIDCHPDEHVVVSTVEDRERWGFGEFNTATTDFSWEMKAPHFAETNLRAAEAVKERAEQTDLLLLATSAQSPVANANPVLTVAEWTVGYEGVYSRDRWFAAFESYAWMHHVYGLFQWRNGRAFDRVIPNFFNPADFPLVEDKDDYLLFVGRVVRRKGAHIAAEIAERAGLKLVIAGPGFYRDGTADGVTLAGDVEYVGEVGPQERARLMGGAKALIAPTVYLEPFGGVAVEAMLCGTPVIASDWGAFTETVTPEVGGRFRSLAEAEDVLDHLDDLDPAAIQAHAVARYSMDAVGPLFSDWFQALDSLWSDGWYAQRKETLC